MSLRKRRQMSVLFSSDERGTRGKQHQRSDKLAPRGHGSGRRLVCPPILQPNAPPISVHWPELPSFHPRIYTPMDDTSDWTATGLFSPSKAKVHQAQAKEWAYLDSWLAKRSRRVPTFERNEETLQALMSLATLNDAADEQRSGVDRVEKAAFSALQKRGEASVEGLHELVLDRLETKSALDTLASLAVLLETPISSALAIGTAVVDLNDAQFVAAQQILRTDFQLQALKAEQDRVKTLLANLKDESLIASPDLPVQTSEWTRSSKHLRAKVVEYNDRLASARSEPKPAVALEDIAKQATDITEQDAQLKQLESELEAFQSLPSDARSARAKLETARDNLRKLTKQRDALFEKLAGG